MSKGREWEGMSREGERSHEQGKSRVGRGEIT